MKVLLIYANCQGDEMTELLGRLRAFAAHYRPEHVFLGALAEFDATRPDAASVFADTALVWEQMSDAFPEERAEFAARLPDGVRHLRFPAFTCSTLYPLVASDPRQPGEGFYPYCDIVAVRIWREMGGATGAMDSVSDAAIFERYMDLSARMLPDLDRVLERDLAQWRERDAVSDVRMADFLQRGLRHEQLFYTSGRPSWRVMRWVLRHLIALSLEDASTWLRAMTELDRLDRNYVGNDALHIPIHPEVAARLGLEWYRPDARGRWFGHNWNFREWVIRCARLSPYL